MTEKDIKNKIIEQSEALAREIAKGKDICITKNASGIVVKKITVQKV